MRFLLVKAFVFLQLSLLLVSCSTVYGDKVDLATETLRPTPAVAPSHHPGHHHHHHHNNTHTPTHSPVHPPVHTPVHPPTHAPVHPPSHTPVHPPAHAPVHPPSHTPVHPPARVPVHPPSHTPVHPPARVPVHAPLHPPSHSPIPPLAQRRLVAVQGVVYCKSCKYKGVGTLLGASPLLGAVVKLTCNNTKYALVEQTKTDKNGYFFFEPTKKLTTYGIHKCRVSLVSSPLPSCDKPTDLHSGLGGAILVPEKPRPENPPTYALFSVGPFAFEPAGSVKCQP